MYKELVYIHKQKKEPSVEPVKDMNRQITEEEINKAKEHVKE